MFRKKENEGVQPIETQGTRPPLEMRPQAQAPELAPRRVELPGVAAARPAEAPRGMAMVQDEAGKRLIVGQGISLAGEITACDRLVVEGSVQVTLNQTRAIEITETGRFTNGRAEVEEAEISGVYEGELTVRRRLLIRGTGQVKGTVRYGELEIERGGRLTGSVSMIEANGYAGNGHAGSQGDGPEAA